VGHGLAADFDKLLHDLVESIVRAGPRPLLNFTIVPGLPTGLNSGRFCSRAPVVARLPG